MKGEVTGGLLEKGFHPLESAFTVPHSCEIGIVPKDVTPEPQLGDSPRKTWGSLLKSRLPKYPDAKIRPELLEEA